MKTTSKTLTLAVAAISMLTATAFAEDRKPRHDACPFTDRLRHWSDVDNHTAILETGVNRRYKVTFMNDCREMRFAIFAKVQSRYGICLSPGDRISFGSRSGIPSDCVISTIERLPPPGQTPVSEPSDDDDD
jgi:hypothetical protein